MLRNRKFQLMTRVVGISVLFALLTLTLSGCGTKTDGSASVDAAPSTPPTVEIVTPVAGAEVAAGDVEVEVKTTGLKFVMASNTNVPGEGHVHFTLDDRPFVMSTEPASVIKDVTPGKHKLVAELVQNDTKPFDPPVKQEIEFVAK